MLSKLLEGVKVIDLTNYGAGPSAARILADWGADVIKVETLEGDISRYNDYYMGVPHIYGTGAFWEVSNANKRAISIDLKTEEGKQIIYKMLAESDVFLTNIRVKALKKLRLDYDTISAKFPHIIWAHLSGYGEIGPCADDPGFDTIAYWARTGGLIDFSEKDTAPLVPPIGFGDFNTGSVLAGGVAAALFKKQKTGKGHKITVSLFGQSIWNMSLMFIAAQGQAVQYPKSRKDTSPLLNTYKCKDGEWILLTVFEWERYFSVICKILRLEELSHDERFATLALGMENRSILIPVMEEKFMLRNAEEWIELFKKMDVPHSKLCHIKDLVHDEQALSNHSIYRITTRHTGEYYMPAPPVQIDGSYAPEHKPAPLLGENTDEVLKESGYTEEQIKDLKIRKIIG